MMTTSSRRELAVCISGQVRTAIEAYPSFRRHFDGADIFIHTWDDPSHDVRSVIDLYQPISWIIETPPDLLKKPPFGNMLYSMMRSNELKRNQEVVRGQRYRTVVKHRFDVILDPIMPFKPPPSIDRTIFFSLYSGGWTPTDFGNKGISDVFFYGDSPAMDIAMDTFWWYWDRCWPRAQEIFRGQIIDPDDSMLSPGSLIFKRCSRHNIMFAGSSMPLEKILRPHQAHLCPIKHWNKIG